MIDSYMPRKHSQKFILVCRTPLTTFGKNLNTKRQIRLEYDATNSFLRLWGYAALKNWFLVEIYESFSQSRSRCMKISLRVRKKNLLCTISIDGNTTWKHINTAFGAPKRWFHECLYQSKHILLKIEHVRVEKVFLS